MYIVVLQTCPIHAMACMLADSRTSVTGDTIFSNHSAAAMNNVLSEVYNWLAEEGPENNYVVLNKTTGAGHTLVAKATSHSARNGGAVIASQHPQVEFSDVGHAGGWRVDKVLKLFVYLKATQWGIAKVGRALAGWTDATQGGQLIIFLWWTKRHFDRSVSTSSRFRWFGSRS